MFKVSKSLGETGPIYTIEEDNCVRNFHTTQIYDALCHISLFLYGRPNDIPASIEWKNTTLKEMVDDLFTAYQLGIQMAANDAQKQYQRSIDATDQWYFGQFKEKG